MKQFFIFLFWIPLVSSAQIRMDSKREKLHGQIKKMVEYEYAPLAHGIQKGVPVKTTVYTYNEETNQEIVFYYEYPDSTRYIFRDIFKFDKDKLVEYYHTQKTDGHANYLEKDSIYYLVTYQYNGNCKLIEEVSRLQDGHSFRNYAKTDYLYDKYGNVIEKDVYYSLDSFNSPFDTIKTIFKYDSGGHVIQEDYYRDQVTYHTIYKYRRHYRYSEEITIDTVRDNEWKTIRRYDNRMNLVEERSYCCCDGTNKRIEYKYDVKNNWVERTYYLYGRKEGYIKRVITYQ